MLEVAQPDLMQSLGLGWNHVIQGGHVKTAPPFDPQTTPRLIMEDPEQA